MANFKNMAQFKQWMKEGNCLEFLFNAKSEDILNNEIVEAGVCNTKYFRIRLKSGANIPLEYPKKKNVSFNEDGTIDFLDDGEIVLTFRTVE